VKFEARLENGQRHSVEVKRQGGQLQVLIDGDPVSVRFRRVNDNQCLLELGGKIVDAVIHRNGVDQEVLIAGITHRLRLIDPRLQPDAGEVSTGGPLAVKAQMPGRVVRVLKATGDNVEKNTAVVVIEAMKMQNDIRAPRAGVIATLEVKEGESVSAGQLLFEIASEPRA
jgi:acetyl/propionyl-CoA carboxylase alpha subunit